MEPKWGTSDDLSKFLRPGGKRNAQRILVRHKTWAMSHGLMGINQLEFGQKMFRSSIASRVNTIGKKQFMSITSSTS